MKLIAAHPASSLAKRRRRAAFTLAELLVAMAIIAVLASITVVSVRGITKDAKLSSGVNAVTAALDNARAMAMKNNRIVLVAFRARFDGVEQYVEIVTAQWTGEAAPAYVDWGSGPEPAAVDRFELIPDVAARQLPRGIKVAGPSYRSGDDDDWLTQSHLPNIDQSTGGGEAPGQMLAVMYAPDGSIITQNSQADSVRTFIDFDRNGEQIISGDIYDYNNGPLINLQDFRVTYFYHVFEGDEPYLSFVPFLAVFDDDVAREQYDTTQWSDGQVRRDNLTFYISQSADRIHFNRYTGVVLR